MKEQCTDEKEKDRQKNGIKTTKSGVKAVMTHLSIGQDIADEGHVGTHVCLLWSVQPLSQCNPLHTNTHKSLALIRKYSIPKNTHTHMN